MSLLWIDLCSSLHDHFIDDVAFTHEVKLGYDGEIYNETYILVGLDDGAFRKVPGEFDAPQGLIVQAWVFDADGNKRRDAYTELSALLKQCVSGVMTWTNANDVDVSLTIQNDGDVFAPNYSVQITVSAKRSLSIALDDSGNCDISKTLV